MAGERDIFLGQGPFEEEEEEGVQLGEVVLDRRTGEEGNAF